MPKTSTRKPVLGQEYQVNANGVIIAQRFFHNLLEPYQQEQVPDYLGLVNHSSLRIESKKKYKKALHREKIKFNALAHLLRDARLSVILNFQGWNGAGKSGAIAQLFEAVWRDNRLFSTIPIGAPTDEELQHDFLWRFHRYNRMPEFGQVHCFDRGWPERVLIEKVMKLTPREQIEASYAQIRAWEQLQASLGHMVIKIWMDITKREQLKRFEDRESEKPDKLTRADKEERKHWDAYQRAINELIYRTGTQNAPWHIVCSQNKRYSRVAVLQLVNGIILNKLLEALGAEELATRLASRLAQVLQERRLCKILVKTLSGVIDRPAMRKLAPRMLEKLEKNDELRKKLNPGKVRRVIAEILDEKND